MQTLTATLLAESNRPAVVRDLVDVVHEEVHEKKGVSGVTVKSAVATVRKVSPNVIGSAIDRMLPEFARVLEPFWLDFDGAGDFGAYLAGRGPEAANALVGVTDQKAESTSRPTLRKAYGVLCGPGPSTTSPRRCPASARPSRNTPPPADDAAPAPHP